MHGGEPRFLNSASRYKVGSHKVTSIPLKPLLIKKQVIDGVETMFLNSASRYKVGSHEVTSISLKPLLIKKQVIDGGEPIINDVLISH